MESSRTFKAIDSVQPLCPEWAEMATRLAPGSSLVKEECVLVGGCESTTTTTTIVVAQFQDTVVHNSVDLVDFSHQRR